VNQREIIKPARYWYDEANALMGIETQSCRLRPESKGFEGCNNQDLARDNLTVQTDRFKPSMPFKGKRTAHVSVVRTMVRELKSIFSVEGKRLSPVRNPEII